MLDERTAASDPETAAYVLALTLQSVEHSNRLS